MSRSMTVEELRELAVRAERAERRWRATNPAMARCFGDARSAAVILAERQAAERQAAERAVGNDAHVEVRALSR